MSKSIVMFEAVCVLGCVCDFSCVCDVFVRLDVCVWSESVSRSILVLCCLFRRRGVHVEDVAVDEDDIEMDESPTGGPRSMSKCVMSTCLVSC